MAMITLIVLVNLQHSHRIHVEYQVEIIRVLTPVEVQEKGINVEPFPNSKSSEGTMPFRVNCFQI